MKKIGILAAVVLILLLATIAWFRFRVPTKSLIFSIFPILKSEPVDQPIRFNHIHHKEVAKLNCLFCHQYVSDHRVAGIPNIELCRACHSSDAISKRPEALKVVEYVKANKRIPWNRMYELPKYIVFPHWIHVENNIDCSTCHGLTGVSDTPLRMVDRDYMEWCIECHQRRGAGTDCYTCHSS
ncbi:MAG: cytochrome c3 family protein [Thermodesulfobacteriota bacterium]